MMYYTGGAWPFGGIIGILLAVAIVVVIIRIILMIIYHVKHPHEHSRHHCSCEDRKTDSQNSAMNILDERYAKGEISDEEYRSKKQNMK